MEKDSLHFKGVGGPDKKTFELNMKFLKEVTAAISKFGHFTITLGYFYFTTPFLMFYRSTPRQSSIRPRARVSTWL